jgi:hypothetical protein
MSKRPPDDYSWHREQIARTARRMFEQGGTVEDALDAVLQAAKREYGWTVVITSPAVLRIDGYDWRWPDG